MFCVLRHTITIAQHQPTQSLPKVTHFFRYYITGLPRFPKFTCIQRQGSPGYQGYQYETARLPGVTSDCPNLRAVHSKFPHPPSTPLTLSRLFGTTGVQCHPRGGSEIGESCVTFNIKNTLNLHRALRNIANRWSGVHRFLVYIAGGGPGKPVCTTGALSRSSFR